MGGRTDEPRNNEIMRFRDMNKRTSSSAVGKSWPDHMKRGRSRISWRLHVLKNPEREVYVPSKTENGPESLSS